MPLYIDDQFRHNIVKVAVDPRGDSEFVFYDNKLSNCPPSVVDTWHKFLSVLILTIQISR